MLRNKILFTIVLLLAALPALAAQIEAQPPAPTSQPSDYEKTVSFGFLPFHVVNYESASPNHSKLQLLDFPLVTGYTREEKGENYVSTGAVKIPLVSLYNSETDQSSGSETTVLRVLFATLLNCERRPTAEKSSWSVLNLWIAHLVKSKSSPEKSHFTLLHVPLVSLFDAARRDTIQSWELLDIPLITLLRSEHDPSSGDFHRQFLTLPFLGSLYSHEKEGNDTELQMLFLYRRHSRG